jgi:uncharacterized phiE125 gp8 family phage protein
MECILYRPVHWRRAHGYFCLTDTRTLSSREIALLVRLKLATFIPSSDLIRGESMSDDTSSVLRLVTAPASEPITLTNAKTFLRIEHNADDEAITRGISAVRLAAEQYLRMALLPQTWDYSVANPSGLRIWLPFGPAQSITSITLTNEAGATTTMAASNYRLSVDGYTVHLSNPQSIEKLTIRYVASIAATASDVPAPILQGMLHHLTVMMENREGSAAIPTQALQCYQSYRRISL